jgi:hypothetical protein
MMKPMSGDAVPIGTPTAIQQKSTTYIKAKLGGTRTGKSAAGTPISRKRRIT